MRPSQLQIKQSPVDAINAGATISTRSTIALIDHRSTQVVVEAGRTVTGELVNMIDTSSSITTR